MDDESREEPKKRLTRKKFLATGAAARRGARARRRAARASRRRSARRARHRPAARTDEELVLYNGTIHTMDGANRVVSGVVIENGRFARGRQGTSPAPRPRRST